MPPAAQSQAGALVALNPELLIAKAIEANVPVESLERLLAMRADLRNEQAVEAFNHALTTFQADIPVILKRRTANTGRYSYQYADIADIQRSIAPRLKACGLSVTFDTRQEGDTLHVACIVHQVDGHSERTEFPVPIDRQARMNETQKVGSALTYGRRYALCAALGIVTAEDDDDGQGAGNVSPSAGKPSASSHPTPQAEGDPSGSAPPVRRNGAPDSEACTAGDGGNARPISAVQHRRLEARISKLGLDSERVRAWVRKATARRPGGPVEHLDELPAALYEKLDGHLEAWVEQARIEAQRAEACRARALGVVGSDGNAARRCGEDERPRRARPRASQIR